jgi:hypothetical protein
MVINYITPAIKIFVGDTDNSIEVEAKKHDPTAFLIDRSNYHRLFNGDYKEPITVYTSLGDLRSIDIFYRVLCLADIIIYCPPVQWSDHKDIDLTNPSGSIKGFTEHVLLLLKNQVEIIGIEQTYFQPTAQPVVDTRKSTKAQMWIVGCSVSHGIGVEIHQRYGNILSDELGIPCSFLTRPGAAIDWASDQIIRADILPNDIVIWGLTDPCRTTYIHENKLLSGVNNRSFERYPTYKKILSQKILVSEDNIYKQIYSIERAINYCKRIKAQLIIVGILNESILLRYLESLPEYVCYPYDILVDSKNQQLIINNFCDLGDDQNHPGPKQHMLYAEFIKKQLIFRNINVVPADR